MGASAACADEPRSAGADSAKKKKIVLIAGPKSHGPVGNRIHDYPWSVKLLKVMLDNSNVREQVAVEYHLDGFPDDPATFADADTILVVSDGRDGDKYQEAPHFRNAQQTARIQEQIDRGCGFATFHFSTFAPDARQAESFEWTGGYFDWETDGKRQWYSAIQTQDAPVQLATPSHPILRGVKPFRMREEFYYNIRFSTEGVTPLWTVPSLDGREPDGRTVAWAKTRADGGRGFGTTCGHFYDNWSHESFRRTMLNALVWTAGLEPPADGVQAPFYSHEQITLALAALGDNLGEGDLRPARLDEQPIRVLMFAGNEAHAWHNWKKTTPAIQSLLERDPRVRVDISHNIEQLATRDLDQYDVIVQNYVNWQDPKSLSEPARRAFVAFLKRGGGLVLIHFANGAWNFSLPEAGESDWPEYRKIVRRVWNHHGEGEAKSGHDAFGRFEVRVADQQNPLTEGLPERFEVDDELYFRQDGDQPIKPLLTARSKVTKRDEPLAWTYQYAEGRVFQTLLGHSEKTYDRFPPREMLRRAVAWAAKRQPLRMDPRRDPLPLKAADDAQEKTSSNSPTKASPPKASRERTLPGKVNAALNADAGRVEIASHPALRQPPLTVDLWVKLRQKRAYNILLASETKASPRHWEIFTQAGTGQLAVYLPGATPDHVRTSVDVCDDRWRRLRMAWGPTRLRLWVDGRQVADQKVELKAGESLQEPLAFGGLVSGALRCSGRIDQVLIRSGEHPPPATAPAGRDGPATTTLPKDTLGFWSFDQVDAQGRFAGLGQVAQSAAAPRADDSKSRAEAAGAARPAAADHWSRSTVGFDWTESDSADGRWNQTDVGRFLACTVNIAGKPTAKGLAIQVGGDGEATAFYDTETMQLRAAWTGGLLRFDPARYGLIRHPRPAGPLAFASTPLAPWTHHTFHYRGAHRHGQRIVLQGEVDGVRVLDACWTLIDDQTNERPRLGKDDKPTATILLKRTIHLAAHNRPLRMQLFHGQSLMLDNRHGTSLLHGRDGAGKPFAVALAIADANRSLIQLNVERQTAEIAIAPHAKPLAFSLLYRVTPGSTDADFRQRLAARAKSETPASLLPLLEPGPPQWTAKIFTKGELGAVNTANADPIARSYVVDTIPLPHRNPYRALMFIGGHDFFANGDAALCTVHGDVWIARGIDDNLDRIHWKRFASGLFQPLGLRIVDDRVVVLGRDQITRLHDRNGDDEADWYECFSNAIKTSLGTHDYVTCLESNAEGDFFFLHAKEGLQRLSRDGRLTTLATGFRNPNGLGLGPDGQLTAAPQEGEWTPGSNVALVKPGGYYGHGGPKITPSRPLGYDPPLCWIPRRLDNSSGGQVWSDPAWGPLGGRLLHLSFGQSSAMLVLQETVGDQRQGGVLPLPWRFRSGVMRGRVHPLDKQLYVSGMTGWVSNAALDGCFQRVRYTGRPPLAPVGVTSYANGVALEFSLPLDPTYVEDPDRYFAERWTYRYSGSYGSEEYRVSDPRVQGRDELEIRSATLLDERTLFLELPEMRPAMQTALRFDVRSRDGSQRSRSTFTHTIHNVPRRSIDDRRLRRRERAGALTTEQQDALRPGLIVRIHKPETTPAAAADVARLAAFQCAAGESPASMIPPGSFQVEMSGLLKSPLKAVYTLRLESLGRGQVWLNGRPVIDTDSAVEEAADQVQVQLHKGYNRLRVRGDSTADGAARLRLLWSGPDFPWEPISPTQLFHDSRSPDIQSARKFQAGVEQFAQRRCGRCHDHPLVEQLPDAQFAGPSLRDTAKRLNRDWLIAWLQRPESLRREAQMPQLLSDSSRRRIDAADLTAFLMQSDNADQRDLHVVPSNSRAVDEGLRLYESLACIACHRFTTPTEEDEFQRLSLHYANAKYRPGAIAKLLLAPHAHYPATRMPSFRLSTEEATALEAFVRSESNGQLATLLGETTGPVGDLVRGRSLFESLNCANCHDGFDSIRPRQRLASINVSNTGGDSTTPCWDDSSSRKLGQPRYPLTSSQRAQLLSAWTTNYARQSTEPATRTAARWYKRLNCAACHDRDQMRGRRAIILLDEGELGVPPEVYPSLTWTGEKLQHDWLSSFIAGRQIGKVRPWLRGRMPAFPAYAEKLADGFAVQHAVPLAHSATTTDPPDPHQARIGAQLIGKLDGLDCRSCHAVGEKQPTGDDRTKIAPGVNFSLARLRMRKDYFHRFLINPSRYEVGTKMPRFSLDGKTTQLKKVYDGDARRQFEAIWHYLQSLEE